MIVRARIVVTMDGPPIENGAVAVSGNRIVDVGKFSEINSKPSPYPLPQGEDEGAASADEIIDLGEQALLPGLINAHCHLDYTCLRGRIPRQKSFTDWIRAINAAKAKLSPEDYIASINEGFAEAKRFGTATIANLTAFPELISQTKQLIRTWWFAELIDVRHPERASEVVDLAVESLKAAESWGLAPHAPYTASANLYRRCEEIARDQNILLTTHLAESREEMSMFRDASGQLFQFMKEIGRDMNDCGHHTPLAQFLDLLGRGGSPNRSEPDWRPRAIEVNRPYLSWIVVHLNELTDEDGKLAASPTGLTSFHVVHCPRSHEYFRHSAFELERLRELGFNICLGTDSLASNDDLSLFAEMRAFQKEFPDISPEKVLEMVTLNSARALRQENALGKIRHGFCADLIAIPCARSTSVFEEVVAFDQPVSWSMIDGVVQKSPNA
ncbi:MAG TPA: amidohydrolase family protein [Chthoniobacterales bacterium]|nr:amidohydrolase family protein [Chthoniobacterales bacterium]